MAISLFSYNISGTPISDMSSYEDSLLSGSSPYIVNTATTVSGYTNITSIENWHLHGAEVLSDYQEKQKAIKLAGYNKGWSACTNVERDIIVDYYANPQVNPTGATQNTEVITHLMTTKGLSYSDSVDYVVDRWWDHWTAFLSDCDSRWRDAVKTTIKHLSFVDASDLFDEIEILVGYYLDAGRLGLDYGDSKEGIMDYVMSTNMYEGNGLEENAYTLKKGTYESFKHELERMLVSEYFWDEIKIHVNNLK